MKFRKMPVEIEAMHSSRATTTPKSSRGHSRIYKSGPRSAAADFLRRISFSIWDFWRLDEVRYMSALDLFVIRVVGVIDNLANRLDCPY